MTDDSEARPAFIEPAAAQATSGASAIVSTPVFIRPPAAEATASASAVVSVGQVLGVIAQDPELFRRAGDLALQTKDGTLPAEEAARQIAQDSPEVASLLDQAPAAARKILIWVLLTAIIIIAEHQTAKLWDPSATPGDVERIVRQHDRDMQREEQRDMSRDVRVAVDRALQEYYSQHPPYSGTSESDQASDEGWPLKGCSHPRRSEIASARRLIL